jgi:hypothetical protein
MMYDQAASFHPHHSHSRSPTPSPPSSPFSSPHSPSPSAHQAPLRKGRATHCVAVLLPCEDAEEGHKDDAHYLSDAKGCGRNGDIDEEEVDEREGDDGGAGSGGR